ncbi:Exo endo phos 2 domain containing protein [Asbolus verrucosus]|uniref:Exo endo phos 2 domain containing protein n=1 Tax=Asbolus verrucosus TaxID=1661398 RepID=A0A482VUM8_ASBVE|nr:Exo endo phos 2 domain containing protein [Asbolus verrucosus]
MQKHVTWGCNRNNTKGNTLYKFTNTQDFHLHHTNTPTHYLPNNITPTTIDLVLTKNITDISLPISSPQLSSDQQVYAKFLKSTVSQRQISRESGISQSSVFRILKSNRFHPYHVTLVQALREADYEK